MKTKENRAYFPRSTPRVLSLAVIFILMLLCLSPTVSAQTDFIVENHNLIEGYLSEVGDEISYYNSIDTTVGKGVASGVSDLINSYRGELLDLESHPDIATRSLRSEASSAFARCVGAGKLGWIYLYNRMELNTEDSLLRFKQVYEDSLSRIAESLSAEALSALCDDLCSHLNRQAYTERARELKRADDSPTSVGYIELGVKELEKAESSELFGGDFAEIFASTKASLTLQRTRDKLYNEIESIYGIIFEGEDFLSDNRVALFTIQLRDASKVSKMNDLARELLCSLTQSDTSSGYAYSLAQSLSIAVSDRALKASNEGVAASFASLFEDYPLNHKRALVKDEISSLLFKEGKDGELIALELYYNGVGGAIDRCTDSAAVTSELFRADKSYTLYRQLTSMLGDLKTVMGPHDSTSLTARANGIYTSAKQELTSLSASSLSFAESCGKLTERSKNALDMLLTESKAERYLLDSKPIITKPKNELVAGDETALRIAITEYLKLEPKVRELLSGQIGSLGEKYKSVLILKMHAIGANDSFFLDLCEGIEKELKDLSTSSIDEFYGKCDLVIQKAEALSAIVDRYRQICGMTAYQGLNAEEKTALSSEAAGGAGLLAELSLSVESYSEALNGVLNSTVISLDRIAETARVRISTRDSSNINIQKLYSDARSSIASCSGRAEMEAIAEKAIFKINRLLTVDAIIAHSDTEGYAVQKLSFLPKEQCTLLLSRIESLKRSMCDEATVAENITVLSFLWSSFNDELTAISREARGADLTLAREHYALLIKQDTDSLESEISALPHLSEARRKELISSALSLSAKFISDIQSKEDSEAVAKAYGNTLEQLSSLRLSARNESLKNYRTVIADELNKLKDGEENYSSKSYEQILDHIASAMDKLELCQSVSACNTLLEDTRSLISAVPDLLTEAKESVLTSLKTALSVCTDSSSLYSKENLALAQRLFDEAVAELEKYQKISDIPSLNSAMDVALGKLRSVNRDLLYSSSSASALDGSSPSYPLGYDTAKGYWARLYSKNGISSYASLSVLPLKSEDMGEIEKQIRTAIKKGDYSSLKELSEKQLKLLKKCTVWGGMDISLSATVASTDSYNLRLLLPDALKDESILALCFIDKDGNAEIYTLARREQLISVDLSHFSSYYILTESNIDLTPLIIFLIILLVFEAILFCFVLFLRYNRRRKENNMLPDSFFYGFNPFLAFSLLGIKPKGAIELTLLLSLAALAMGCGIAFLARTELSFLKKQDFPQPTPKKKETLPERSTPRLKKSETQLLPEAEEIPVLCGARGEACQASESAASPQINAEENEDMVAFVLRDDIPEFEEAHEGGSPLHRAEVNLDVIAKKFAYGELVTVEALKKKRLISKKADFVKILARGVLTKPLIIEAHDFSRAAEDMLNAVGGEAVRIKG